MLLSQDGAHAPLQTSKGGRWWCWGPAATLSSAALLLSLCPRRLLSLSEHGDKPDRTAEAGRAAPAAGCYSGGSHSWLGTGPLHPARKAPLLRGDFTPSHTARGPLKPAGRTEKQSRQILYPKELLWQPGLALSSVQTSTQRLGQQALNSPSAPQTSSFLEALICPQQQQRARSSAGSQHSERGRSFFIRKGKGKELQKQTSTGCRASLHLPQEGDRAPGVALLEKSKFQPQRTYLEFSGLRSTVPRTWKQGIASFWKSG